MNCIEKIVTVGLCDTEESTSGFSLMKSPGISPKNAANMVQEQYKNINELLDTIKQNAINIVRTDFNAFLYANRIATTLTNRVYDSASFNTSKTKGFYNGMRGQTIWSKVPHKTGNMANLKIHGIDTYTIIGGEGEIVIMDFDNGVPIYTTYQTTFNSNELQYHELPTPYVAKSTQVSVMIDNTSLSFSSSKVICGIGCGGTPKNPCGKVEGWDGTRHVREEGFGMNIHFSCGCDYDKLICDLTPVFTGELIWYKMQELFWQEAYQSNRFTPFVTYNRDDMVKVYIPQLQDKYSTKFNSMVGEGIFNILKTYKDDCLNCRGIQLITNI